MGMASATGGEMRLVDRCIDEAAPLPGAPPLSSLSWTMRSFVFSSPADSSVLQSQNPAMVWAADQFFAGTRRCGRCFVKMVVFDQWPLHQFLHGRLLRFVTQLPHSIAGCTSRLDVSSPGSPRSPHLPMILSLLSYGGTDPFLKSGATTKPACMRVDEFEVEMACRVLSGREVFGLTIARWKVLLILHGEGRRRYTSSKMFSPVPFCNAKYFIELILI